MTADTIKCTLFTLYIRFRWISLTNSIAVRALPSHGFRWMFLDSFFHFLRNYFICSPDAPARCMICLIQSKSNGRWCYFFQNSFCKQATVYKTESGAGNVMVEFTFWCSTMSKTFPLNFSQIKNVYFRWFVDTLSHVWILSAAYCWLTIVFEQAIYKLPSFWIKFGA